MRKEFTAALLCALLVPASARAQMPPYDLWTGEVLMRIRDTSTLEPTIQAHAGTPNVWDVFFTSNAAASFFDETPPYAEHTNEKIRIHAFLAVPASGGPYPALVIGHGHGGQAELTLAQQVASFGYVALYIDGPRAGLSTGGPKDDNQAWISVDKGAEYGYLYHYGYAGMRALTMLEELANRPGNLFRIDPGKLGAMGASMGGIFTTYLNGIDSRMKAAVIMASAGSWANTLRYPNSWLYHGLATGTADAPYNGSDPPNSIEDVDRDPTAIAFLNHFDPIRYAPRQYAPVLTVIGTHDGYFPLPSANLMLQTMAPADRQSGFEKRLWLIPNAPHGLTQNNPLLLLQLQMALKGFLDYAFGLRASPLATPKVSMTVSGGLRFEIALDENPARLSNAQAVLYAATRVDSTVSPINDFKAYTATLQGGRFIAQIPEGEKASSGDAYTDTNVLYFATVTDSGSLPVSSLVYKGALPIDLSTGFLPVIDLQPDGKPGNLPPPPAPDAAETISSSIPVTDRGYQGLALANPTGVQKGVRIEARTPEGRIAVAEGLINPIYLSLPPFTQQVFVDHQWFGPGAPAFNGSMRTLWTDAPSAFLSFRGSDVPPQLVEVGPTTVPSTNLWLALAPEQDGSATRRLRIFGGSIGADVQIIYRNRFGDSFRIPSAQVKVAAQGIVDITPPAGAFAALIPASAEIQATNPVSARLEVSGAGDPWSIEACPVAEAARWYQPHTEWNGDYTTRLIFLNPSGSVRQVMPHLRTTKGEELGLSVALLLAPFSVQSFTVESLFSLTGSGKGAGWMDIETPGGPVVIVALAVNALGASAASALESGGAGSWSMPFYVEGQGYWTGLAIANVGAALSNITMVALDRAGNRLGTWQETLNSQQSKTLLVSQWIQGLPAGTSGQIIIMTSGSAALVAYFGTNDDAALAAIPLTLIAPGMDGI